MRINKDTRQAIIALSCLHKKYTSKQAMSLQQISETSNIALQALVQLFHKLKQANVVKSIRGPGGGYFLNADYYNLTLAQVMLVMEGDVMAHSCKGKRNCNQGKQCKMHTFWTGIGQKIDAALSGVLVFNPDYNPMLKQNKNSIKAILS